MDGYGQMQMQIRETLIDEQIEQTDQKRIHKNRQEQIRIDRNRQKTSKYTCIRINFDSVGSPTIRYRGTLFREQIEIDKRQIKQIRSNREDRYRQKQTRIDIQQVFCRYLITKYSINIQWIAQIAISIQYIYPYTCISSYIHISPYIYSLSLLPLSTPYPYPHIHTYPYIAIHIHICPSSASSCSSYQCELFGGLLHAAMIRLFTYDEEESDLFLQTFSHRERIG